MMLRLPFIKKPPIVSVVRMSGTIGMAGRASLTDAALAPILEKAFKRGKPVAVALEINSPGGSPVQSSLIGARIRRAEIDKVHTILLVGQREQEAGKLAVREHGRGDLGAKPREEVIAGLLNKIKNRES